MATRNISRRQRIKHKVRKSISGTTGRPRLTVFRSNKQFYAQVIDDSTGQTITSASSRNDKKLQTCSKIEQAKLIGTTIAEQAKKLNVKSVVFDRNGYLYHGRVKNFCEAAREGGLAF